jgi:hypothetical protein
MGILTDDMKRLVNEQQPGFHATVCPMGRRTCPRRGRPVCGMTIICSSGTSARGRQSRIFGPGRS